MRHFNTYSLIFAFLFAIIVAGFVPSFVYAQPAGSGQGFITLVPQLPLLGNQTTVPQLLNALFGITIAIAAILAVLMFVIGGFRYMASEAIGSKGDAKSQMQSAVLGLVLVLVSILILNTINPDITMLNIFRDVPENARPPDANVNAGTAQGQGQEIVVACAAPDTPDACCAANAGNRTVVGAQWLNANQAKCTLQ